METVTKTNYKEAVEQVAELLKKEDSDKWLIGDIAKRLPKETNKDTDTVMQIFAKDVAKKTGKNWEDEYIKIHRYKRVSKNFVLNLRRQTLTFTHHELVMVIPNKESQLEILDECVKNKWSTYKLKEYLSESAQEDIKEWQRQYLILRRNITTFHQNIDLALQQRVLELIKPEQAEVIWQDFNDLTQVLNPFFEQLRKRFKLKEVSI